MLTRSLEGSASAPPPLDFHAVYRQHVQQVARWVTRLGGPVLEVDDVVQEIFMTVYRLLSSFRGASKLSTWLYSITEHAVMTRRRKERFRRMFTFSADPYQYEVTAQGPTPLEELERRQSARVLYRALEGVAENYRAIFILFEIEGLSGEEIAELTGLTLPTVWVRLSRARKKLIARIEKERGSHGGE